MNAKSRDLEKLFRVGTCGSYSDGQLLERFIAGHDEASFEALVQRHAAMVWGVCRRVLRRHHDAEDAFQATFLVLARKANSVNQRETLGNWLYAVAYQTARKARAMSSRREGRERQVSEMPEPTSAPTDPWGDLTPLLDEELSRLPAHYRAPIILCDLEGKTRKEAARQLGWPEGTISSRLSRARSALAKRLSRRGIALPAGALATLLADNALTACPPRSLVPSTARTAALVGAGEAIVRGGVSVNVATLTGGVLNSMFISKLKVAAVVLVAAGLLGTGLRANGRADQAQSEQSPNTTRPAGSTDKPHQPVPPLADPHRQTLYDQVFRAQLRDEIGRGPEPDDALIRRVYLDILGRIPTPEEVQKYKERQAETRSKLVQWLLTEVSDKGASSAAKLIESHKHVAGFLDQMHRSADSRPWKPTIQNCASCHSTQPNPPAPRPDTVGEALRREVIRDLLVKQAVRDIDQIRNRLKQDMPDRQTELNALEEIEKAVRTRKQRLRGAKL